MKKSSLRTGMVIVLNNGAKMLVMKGEGSSRLPVLKSTRGRNVAPTLAFLTRQGEVVHPDSWAENLTHKEGGLFDVESVLIPADNVLQLAKFFHREDLKGSFECIWKREKAVPRLTQRQIEKALGYRIEIV